jgi:hypothetical protein
VMGPMRTSHQVRVWKRTKGATKRHTRSRIIE